MRNSYRVYSVAMCVATALVFGLALNASAGQQPSNVAYDTPTHDPRVVIYPQNLEVVDSTHSRGFTRWTFDHPRPVDALEDSVQLLVIRVGVDCADESAVVISRALYKANGKTPISAQQYVRHVSGISGPWGEPAPDSAAYHGIARAMCAALKHRFRTP